MIAAVANPDGSLYAAIPLPETFTVRFGTGGSQAADAIRNSRLLEITTHNAGDSLYLIDRLRRLASEIEVEVRKLERMRELYQPPPNRGDSLTPGHAI